jgi:ferritin-like metal-binding protein YciE
MPAVRSPEELLGIELKAIHSAERQLSRALPRLKKQVSSESLAQMLDTRLEQGEVLIEEIEGILEEMETTKARPKNLAAEGLIEDLNQHLELIDNEKLIDPVLLASIQKVEHYCIAAWGTAASMGRLLEAPKVVKTMERVLGEGKTFDEEMTKLAELEVNPAMLAEGVEGEEREAPSSRGKRRNGRKSR